MMIQQQARKNLQERVQRWDPDHKDSQVDSEGLDILGLVKPADFSHLSYFTYS